jgi:hypothetical protein
MPFREEILKGVFFLIKFKDFLSYRCFRYNITISYLKYKNYFRYVFERKTFYIYNTERYLVYNFIS